MASRARRFGWLAAMFAVLVWVLCAVPLAAQSLGRIAIRSDVQVPIYAIAQVTAPVDTAISESPISFASDQASSGVPATAVPATADALIEQMSLAAGVIFAGQVTAVRKPIGFAGSGQYAAEGIVEIDLHVDQSLRGPAAGSIYTLREWSGLWVANSERYRPGELLLLFLYPPDAHGLSSPVHGAEGAIPLRGSGVAPGPDDGTAAAAEWLVDLRWLQAQVLRRHRLATLPVHNPIDPISLPTPGPIPGPTPLHGIVPERGVDRSMIESDPLLVRAIREPWLRPTPATVETQPLSQVLALCHEAMTLDAMRHRDAIQ